MIGRGFAHVETRGKVGGRVGEANLGRCHRTAAKVVHEERIKKASPFFPQIPCLSSLLPSSIIPRRRRRHFSPVMTIPNASDSWSSFSKLAPLEAILFDIDGTLCDSDPLHFYAFRELLQEIGFNGGVPIDEDFFVENISGRHNDDICHILFPDRDIQKCRKFVDDKEAVFRRLASEQLKPVEGLHKLVGWLKDHGLKRAAVTNAPRENAELMISILGLSEFFDYLIVGSECERAKPFPDPYLKGLDLLKVSPDHTFVFEDSVSGIKAGVAAGMPVVGLTTRNPEIPLREAGATLLINDFEDPKLWTVLDEFDKAATAKTD